MALHSEDLSTGPLVPGSHTSIVVPLSHREPHLRSFCGLALNSEFLRSLLGSASDRMQSR